MYSIIIIICANHWYTVGGSKEVFIDGIIDKEIWPKKCENGQTMYLPYQFVESYTENPKAIDKNQCGRCFRPRVLMFDVQVQTTTNLHIV